MRPRLSICIPTFNRATYLRTTLDSIATQANDQIEIVVSDNASTDETAEIIREYQGRVPRLTYYCWPENMGPDRNYLKVAELAQGEYFWWLGSDDALCPAAVQRMLALISGHADIYLCNRWECDAYLRPRHERYWLEKSLTEMTVDTRDRVQLLRYLDQARSIGALFSYISGCIVRKARWSSVAVDESLLGTAYAYVYVLFSLLRSGARLTYTADRLVLNRGGPTSFDIPGNVVARIRLDIDGYRLLAEKVFAGDEEMRRAIMQVVFREASGGLGSTKLRLVARFGSPAEEWRTFLELYESLYGAQQSLRRIDRLPAFPTGLLFCALWRTARGLKRCLRAVGAGG